MFWDFLRDFEAGDFSSWIREGNFIAEPFSTFYTLLGFHSIGMAAVVGIGWMLSARIFGFHQEFLISKTQRLLQLAWWGFYLNLASGILLLMGQPRREFLTGLFWVKMLSIVMALITMLVVQKGIAHIKMVPNGNDKLEAVPLSLRVNAFLVCIFWLVAIVAGRLIGYTQPPPPM
ncbi:MAG: hypothetical protein EBY21_11445 [Alphaproteobacteria bacterium]|nr:hypothetical protein [Alphaproteobacteria bacterium]